MRIEITWHVCNLAYNFLRPKPAEIRAFILLYVLCYEGIIVELGIIFCMCVDSNEKNDFR